MLPLHHRTARTADGVRTRNMSRVKTWRLFQFVHSGVSGESEIRTRRPAFASRLASNEVASPVAVSPGAEGGRVELPDPKATQVRAELRRQLPSFQSGEQRCRSPEQKLVPVFKARWPAAAILSKKRKQEGMIPTARAAHWLATRSGPRPVLLPLSYAELSADRRIRTFTLHLRRVLLDPSSCIRRSGPGGS